MAGAAERGCAAARAAVLRDSANPAGIAQFGAIQTAAQSLGVELRPVDVRRECANPAPILPGEKWKSEFDQDPVLGGPPSSLISMKRACFVFVRVDSPTVHQFFSSDRQAASYVSSMPCCVSRPCLLIALLEMTSTMKFI
jgi:hypothetical protein